jgi:hypothetical protein
MGMNDISPDHSEAIIEAAARGQIGPEADVVGGLLASLHAPGTATGTAPVVGLANNGFAGRVARRTAVAASAAVLGLASVAAAATGAGGLLADDSASTDLEDAIVEEAEVDETEEESSGQDAPDETEAAPGADEARGGGNRPEIEGVDAADGLDEAELELLCEGAENHGHYVSTVARDKSTEGEASHGERVREAAASDCGKDDVEDDGDEDESEDSEDEAEVEDETSDDDEDAADEASDDGRSGNGHGKAKGNGHGEHGNGNGHGHDRD